MCDNAAAVAAADADAADTADANNDDDCCCDYLSWCLLATHGRRIRCVTSNPDIGGEYLARTTRRG